MDNEKREPQWTWIIIVLQSGEWTERCVVFPSVERWFFFFENGFHRHWSSTLTFDRWKNNPLIKSRKLNNSKENHADIIRLRVNYCLERKICKYDMIINRLLHSLGITNERSSHFYMNIRRKIWNIYFLIDRCVCVYLLYFNDNAHCKEFSKNF